MPEIPTSAARAVPAILAVVSALSGAAAGSGVGLPVELADGTIDVNTWPVIITSVSALVGAVGMSASQFKSAALAPPADDKGKTSARHTISIAIGQAYREGDTRLVTQLSDTLGSTESENAPRDSSSVPSSVSGMLGR